MNIEYINAIPLCTIFDKLKLYPVQQSDLHILYPSPFQSEETHTMEVHPDNNTWFDSSTNTSGGPLDLIGDWLHYNKMHCSLSDIQHWFRFNIGYPSMQDGIPETNDHAPEIKYVYKSPILNPLLIKSIEDKGIAYEFARKYLRQIGLTDATTGEEFSALGLRTEELSWWAYSPYINAITGAKAITYIRGQKYSFRTVHIFKDIFDYLTALIIFNDCQPFDDECIILNSYECLENSAQYIRGFGYRHLFSWLGNDPAGQQATDNYALLCSIEENLKHKPMNRLYASCLNLNDWHVKHRNR